MAIFRGSGGSGDATTDAQNEASVASIKAAEAASSATSASASATSAATSATNAATSETNASTSASTAGGHASSASTSASAASTSATNAGTSETNALTSETNAASSASAAATSATNAATSETNSATSETNAATSESNAATSETNAAASYDSFDDRYLGAKSSAPTLDNDGDALLTGALYWNNSVNNMYVWTGSSWAITAGGASIINELSDVVITTPVLNQVLKYNGTNWVNDSDTDTGILYTDLSVTSNAVGTAALTYNNTTGVFTYTPPDLSSYLTSYTETDPVYTASSWYSTTNNSSNWNTAFGWGNHASIGYLTSFTETNDLSTAVTWANVPDANITQSSVTQHEAALSITESQISDLKTYVEKTSNTGAAEMPSGTTAERDGSPSAGYLRFNSTTTGFEGYDGSAWGAIGGGGGASAGGAIYENTDEITADYTLTAGSNGMSVGPMTIAGGVSVTIPSGQRWVVL